jgi:hypothetical protein
MACGSYEVPNVMFSHIMYCSVQLKRFRMHRILLRANILWSFTCLYVHRSCKQDTRVPFFFIPGVGPWNYDTNSHLTLYITMKAHYDLSYIKTNMCTSNIHTNTISCLLLRASATLCHLQGVYIWMFRIRHSMIQDNGNNYSDGCTWIKKLYDFLKCV